MCPIVRALASLTCVVTAWGQSQRVAPSYTADTIVNLASGEPGRLAPNTLAAIYGHNLAPYSRARQAGDLLGDYLPFQLSGTGVTVKVGGLLAPIEYISPQVVTFLVPAELRAGPVTIILTYNALNGPTARVQLSSAAPAWFQIETGFVLGRHRDTMQWIDDAHPALPGEEIVLYVAGLGDTSPLLPYREFPRDAIPLAAIAQLYLSFDGVELPRDRLRYAGLTPGFPGVYELHLVLPEQLPQNPQLELEVAGDAALPGTRLRFQPTVPQPDAPPARSTR